MRKENNILIPTTKGVQLEKIKNILCVCAEGSYSELILTSGAKHMISKNLSNLTSLLPDQTFFRIHSSVIINISHIVEIIENEVVMTNDFHFPIAQRRKKEFLEFLKRNSLAL
ncbi:LytR/AlgR family response regulator transcription factor [Roseivirga misakiensis]|uniref:HTH LytTR-type domain-containing protein n=1 Tax=Roseivirga misakiensis TaxID=1563681 RepID=A0A1E5T6B5_9BACT|nr:LytTR family DNA-binding domain-containing protein [Roseivirga misakiensis]OEK06900.1 hypothetical protein BFP71_04390 [Roseivirga misakiensis]